MPKILKIAAFIIIAFVMIILVLPFVIPVDNLKAPVLAKIEAATGRKVTIGKISLSLFPNIALEADDVSIGNPGWAGTGNMVDIKTLRLGVELLPLLHKQVYIKELTLESPVIALVKKGAEANWQFTPSEISTGKQPVMVKNEKGEEPEAMQGSIIPENVNIKNGKLSFNDMDARIVKNITDINLDLKAPNPSEKMVFNGKLVLDGKKIDLSLDLSKPLALSNGAKSDVDMKLVFGDLKLAWQGTLAFAGSVPSLTGKVTIPEINVAALSDKNTQAASSKKSAGSAQTGQHWSNEPINMSGLNNANASLSIVIEKLILKQTTLADIELNVHLANGALSVASNDITAYGGVVKFTLGATSTNKANLAANVTNVKAEPLLQDFAGSTKLSGTLDAQVSVATQGASERAMVNALAGQGNFHFKDGKFKGADLSNVARNFGMPAADNKDQSTSFSELSGTFTITNGIVSNNDLKVNSPMLRVGGEGTVDLPNWQVQYLVQPKLVVSAEGQGGKDANGITIPIRVEGPLDSPHYRPDVQAAIKSNLANPGALKNTVEQLKTNPGSALKGILR